MSFCVVTMSTYNNIVFIFLICQIFSWSVDDVSAAATYFRRDYDLFHNEKAFYKVHSIPKSWNDARKQCVLEGATLAVPNTAAEAEIFKHLMKKKMNTNSFAYMGIQAFSKGIFTTFDGILIDDIYHGWAPGEPNDVDHKEDCVIMGTDGKLIDVNCCNKNPFICEKSQESVTWNSACETPDLELWSICRLTTLHIVSREDDGVPYRDKSVIRHSVIAANPTLVAYTRVDGMDHCYKVHLEPKTWQDAYATCVAEQSYLAILNSRAESKALINLFNTKPHQSVTGNYLAGAIHIGFYDRFAEGVYTTIQGQTLTGAGFDKWGGGQPDHPGSETCGSIFYDGELNDIGCSHRCFFICERVAGDGSSALSLRFAGLH